MIKMSCNKTRNKKIIIIKKDSDTILIMNRIDLMPVKYTCGRITFVLPFFLLDFYQMSWTVTLNQDNFYIHNIKKKSDVVFQGLLFNEEYR